jgi:hypothetical protein
MFRHHLKETWKEGAVQLVICIFKKEKVKMKNEKCVKNYQRISFENDIVCAFGQTGELFQS